MDNKIQNMLDLSGPAMYHKCAARKVGRMTIGSQTEGYYRIMICPECGLAYSCNTAMHAYRIRGTQGKPDSLFCSWHCLRDVQKRTEDPKRAAMIQMQLRGDSTGTANPSAHKQRRLKKKDDPDVLRERFMRAQEKLDELTRARHTPEYKVSPYEVKKKNARDASYWRKEMNYAKGRLEVIEAMQRETGGDKEIESACD